MDQPEYMETGGQLHQKMLNVRREPLLQADKEELPLNLGPISRPSLPESTFPNSWSAPCCSSRVTRTASDLFPALSVVP